MYRGGFYRGGPEVLSAIAGINQALWDIKGKFYYTSVNELLRGTCREKIREKSIAGLAGTGLLLSGRWHWRLMSRDTWLLERMLWRRCIKSIISTGLGQCVKGAMIRDTLGSCIPLDTCKCLYTGIQGFIELIRELGLGVQVN